MKQFSEYERHEQDYAVKIMRADYNCQKTPEEWRKAAIAVNPPVENATYALPRNIVELIAEQAGEKFS